MQRDITLYYDILKPKLPNFATTKKNMHCFTLTNKSHKSSTGMSDFDESPTKRK